MKKTAIVYGVLENEIQKRALEQISSIVLEHTLEYPPCIKYSDMKCTDNFRYIYIGTKSSNPYIAKNSSAHLSKEEEYNIDVLDDRVIIEGYDDAGVLYGCIDFYNKYIVKYENTDNGDIDFINVFEQEKLFEFSCTSSPSTKHRGIWTWGHVIYNYRNFIDNMMKLKLNTIIIWNDFVPTNAKDMIEYAHNCNIKVIWGYSWLWDTKCAEVNINNIYNNIDSVLDKYEKEYSNLNVDGIYFQSFTELNQDKIGDVLIAEAVTNFVNETASRFFEKFGEIELQFGLHATSVKEKLNYIKKTDPRVRLYWEDCGSFPFAYCPKETNNYEKTKEFTKEIANLRENEKFGVVTKGIVKLDWKTFEHIPGPVYINKCSKPLAHNRIDRKNKMWRYVQAYWMTNADKALDMVKTMCDETNGNLYITALVEDGMFEENIMFPVALFSEIMWDCNADVKKLTSDVALRSYVEFA